MNHTFKNENGHLIANVSFDADEIKTATSKAVHKLIENVTVPGFRKGKAPEDMAVKYIHGQDLNNETINALLRMLDKNFEKDEEFSSYIKEGKFFNNLHPAVSLKKFEATGAEFEVTYFLRPYISKLGEYKGLKSDVKEKKVTAKDVDAELERLAKDNAELVPTENPSEMGDTVNIDFVGLMNGQPFDGGSANSFDLELGSNRFVPGFEEQCVSHKAGDKFDVSLTMPDNYPEPLTSKPVVFKVTLNAVKHKEVPEINDEFATTLSGQYVSKDLEELKAKIKENLSKNAFEQYKKDTINDLLVKVRDSSEFVLTEEVVSQFVNNRIDSDTNNLEAQGIDLDEYLKLVKQEKADYEKNIRDGIVNELKYSMVYNSIATEEKIPSPSREDVEKQLGQPLNKFIESFTNYLKSQKMDKASIDHQVQDYINQVVSSIMTGNVQAKILELNDPELAKRSYVPSTEKKTSKKSTSSKVKKTDEETEAVKDEPTSETVENKEDKAE